ncbi:MAG: sulfatase-like hydrolase/transferase [Verrucomicrobiae bacterium]|nr:sulfatase-like hydrolase/transferase [Verrucomicrobiae bacterium]
MKPLFSLAVCLCATVANSIAAADKPHIVLVMADDMGWGQTGYYDHPVLKTPNLDAMAANGLRFDRFYAGAPNCSPTRASVMTGRSNDRTGVLNHGYALHRQERTVAQALRDAGYVTGHFGKWHLNGLRGPGVPVLASDDHNPGEFGFDEWLSVTNFFDRNPILSRMGEFEEFEGDSSEIVVAEAMKFIDRHREGDRPTFTVIWYGTPHSPFVAGEDDKSAFADLDKGSANHYGELVAMDRSIGTLRAGLREYGIEDNTLFWFCSDNGGLPEVKPDSVGGLRGHKGSVFEGGLRVPAIIEWPSVITEPRITSYPAATLDIFPTLAEVVGAPDDALLAVRDGLSLRPMFTHEIGPREKPIPFRHQGRAAIVDNRYKLLSEKPEKGEYQLYDLEADPKETTDLSTEKPEVAARLQKELETFSASVDASQTGADYPEGKVNPGEPPSRNWMETPEYAPFLDELQKRPEYAPRLKPAKKKAKK